MRYVLKYSFPDDKWEYYIERLVNPKVIFFGRDWHGELCIWIEQDYNGDKNFIKSVSYTIQVDGFPTENDQVHELTFIDLDCARHLYSKVTSTTYGRKEEINYEC